MKKTKFLTCLAALTLLLAGCETAAENLDTDTSTTESGDTTTSDTGTGGDTGEGGEEEGESRLGLLGEAFKLVGGANYTLTCYSTAVNTDDHRSYTGVVTSVGAISTSYTGSTTGMINDPDGGGFVEVTLDGDVLKASAAPDPTRSVQDYYISSNIDTALFEELEDGRFALKDEGFTSNVLQDLFPDKPFTGGLITPTKGTIFIEVEDDLSKVTYYYDSSFLGNYTVTLVVENLGTTVFPYDLTTQYVGVGSEEVNSWATYLTETQKTSADNILGADMDDILPFYVPEVGYQFNTMNGKINLYAQSAGYDLCEPWAELLVEFGYDEVTSNKEYKLEGETVDYTVTLNNYGGTSMFDLYLYPVEKPVVEDPNLEVAQAILDAATNTQYLEWDALHASEYDDGELTASVYLTLDDSSKAYGYWYQYDDGDPDVFNYYVDGTKYVYDSNEDEGEQYYIASTGANIDLDTFLDDYSEALGYASDIDLTEEGTTYTLSEDGTKLDVEITSTNDYGISVTTSCTYIANDDLEIVGVGLYEPDIAGISYGGYYAELITSEEVAAAMGTEFYITNWQSGDEGETSGEHEHSWKYVASEKDEHYHVQVCEVCGVEGATEAHRASDDNGVCEYCGQTGLNTNGITYVDGSDGGYCVTKIDGQYADVYIPAEHDGKTVTAVGTEGTSGSSTSTSGTVCTGSSSLTFVSLPNTVTEIYPNAFNATYNMSTIILSESLTTIEAYTFARCIALKSIDIPEGVETLDTGCLRANNSSSKFLESIVIPASLKTVSSGVFYYQSTLTDVYYKGTAEDWENIEINSSNNSYFTDAARHYYDEDGSLFEADTTATYTYWHYVDGVPTLWE